MRIPKARILKYAAMGIIAAFIATFFLKKEKQQGHPRDYAEIAAEKIIRAATEYNSISFYVDGDTLSGFHYELIEAFARDHGWKAAITPEMSFDKRLEDSLFVKSQLDLAGKTLHVVKGSPSILRIRNLGNEIGDTIYIKEIDKYGSEQLISLVAHGDIDYAVCDESIARAVTDSIPQIDINTDISFTQFYSWGVSKQSPVLLDSLNSWLQTFRNNDEFKSIYRKYYRTSNQR